MKRYSVIIFLENGDCTTHIEYEADSPKDAIEKLYADSNEMFLIVELIEGQTMFIPRDKVLKIAVTKNVMN